MAPPKNKDATLTVKEEDWTAKTIRAKAVGQVDGKATVLVGGGKLSIHFDVLVPGKSLGDGALAESNLRYAEDGVKAALAAFKKRVSSNFEKGLEKIVELHDGGGQSGYSTASSTLDKLNKYMRDNLEDLRPKVREAVAKKLGLSAKELQTIGACKFSEMRIERGVFQDELELESPTSADVAGALKRRGWQYCGVAWSGESAVVGIDKKKEFNKSRLKELATLLDITAPKLVAGRVKAESQTNVIFQFKKKDKGKLPNEGAVNRVLRIALNVQTGKKMSNVEATPFVDRFDEEKKGPASASD